MKRERLFRILGLIDDGLIEEASSVFTSAPPRKQRFWMPALAAAACVALICAVTVPTLFQGGGSKSEAPAAEAAPKAEEPAAPGGSSGSGINKHKSETESDVVTDNEPLSVEGTQFMSYAGPVFPLTLAEETQLEYFPEPDKTDKYFTCKLNYTNSRSKDLNLNTETEETLKAFLLPIRVAVWSLKPTSL